MRPILILHILLVLIIPVVVDALWVAKVSTRHAFDSLVIVRVGNDQRGVDNDMTPAAQQRRDGNTKDQLWTIHAPNDYTIRRPRWFNRNEADIVRILVPELKVLQPRAVEKMLDSCPNFRDEDPELVRERIMFLMKFAPEANFNTMIRRHPRTLLVPLGQLCSVVNLIHDCFPGATMGRVLERIPFALSRNVTKLEINIKALAESVPEVDSAIFQAAPSVIFLPPDTTRRKASALRSALPGVNLGKFLRGMPTALIRTEETLPKALKILGERFPGANKGSLVQVVAAAPSLVTMAVSNGTLDGKVSALERTLPGLDMTNVLMSAPGLLARNTSVLAAKVERLRHLFPTANVTSMVSRTPGILTLDPDRTVRPKAEWLRGAVDLAPEDVDGLIEEGPWLLKAGWGPLARLEFAAQEKTRNKVGTKSVDSSYTSGASGESRKGMGSWSNGKPWSGLAGLVRMSRSSFAVKHPSYGGFLERQLQEELGMVTG
ncbi:unnamed protein product, partial [Discosporangium mesarthrocarpum]